jgi:hypothetical protein
MYPSCESSVKCHWSDSTMEVQTITNIKSHLQELSFYLSYQPFLSLMPSSEVFLCCL